MKYQADLWDLERESKMEEKRETVYALFDMGMPDDKIAQAVRTTIDTVRQWLESRPVMAK